MAAEGAVGSENQEINFDIEVVPVDSYLLPHE